MMGHLFGVPHHRQLQRQVVEALFQHLISADQSGDISFFDYTWAQARKEAKKLGLKK